MLRKLEIQDAYVLHDYLLDPHVYPYVRFKAETLDEYLFVSKQVIEKEEQSKLIMRVILDETGKAIGQIALYDIEGGTGFLGTWLGTEFHGKGYNQLAKDSFLREVFYQHEIHTVYMKIRKTNEKSKRAALKLPYIETLLPEEAMIYQQVNQEEEIYDVFKIQRELYEQYAPNMMEA